MSEYYPHFNGPEYIPERDHDRLTHQHDRIKTLMIDGRWRTLSEIARATEDPEPSISAQLRHLRKERFGSFILERRQRGEEDSGLFEYRILPPGSESQFEVKKRRNKLRESLRMVWDHPDTTEAIRKEITRIMKS